MMYYIIMSIDKGWYNNLNFFKGLSKFGKKMFFCF